MRPPRRPITDPAPLPYVKGLTSRTTKEPQEPHRTCDAVLKSPGVGRFMQLAFELFDARVSDIHGRTRESAAQEGFADERPRVKRDGDARAEQPRTTHDDRRGKAGDSGGLESLSE
jgi:hypothetical protein